jgi:hypothetical protein
VPRLKNKNLLFNEALKNAMAVVTCISFILQILMIAAANITRVQIAACTMMLMNKQSILTLRVMNIARVVANQEGSMK